MGPVEALDNLEACPAEPAPGCRLAPGAPSSRPVDTSLTPAPRGRVTLVRRTAFRPTDPRAVR